MQQLESPALSIYEDQNLRGEYLQKTYDGPAARRKRPFRFSANHVLLLLVTGYCAWVFSLPVFPTQDGAIHLYYTQVLSRLLSRSPLYSQYFAIRYPIPPYALHYALLLGLTKLVHTLIAEKAVVCLTIGAFVYGFRAFARQLGPSAGVATLWIVPLSLNWMVGMGFHSFCLAMGLGLWAMAAWLRAVATRSRSYQAAYCVLLTLILFTHPVPLAITVAFVASELLFRMAQQGFLQASNWKFLLRRHIGITTDIGLAVLSFVPLMYIGMFLTHDGAPSEVHIHHMRLKTVLSLAGLKTLSLLGKNPAGYTYRLSFYVILLIAAVISLRGFRHRWSMRKFRLPDVLVLGSLGLGVVIPVLPRTVNGSDYFADRMIIYIWIGVIAAAACYVPGSIRLRRIIATGGTLFALTALILADHYVRPVAQRVALLESICAKAPGERGIFLDPPVQPQTAAVSFDPFIWAAARYFRQTDTIMLNAPWLELPILPLESRSHELGARLAYVYDYPDLFRDLLADSKPVADRMASVSQFVVGAQYPGSTMDPITASQWPRQLSCEKTKGFQLCAKSLD